MNNEIQTFNFNSATLRTLTDEHGDPWFVLKDCMSILALGNPTETVKMFDDDEFSTTEVIDSIGRRQQTYVISESGFYRLVIKSRKPEAHEFQRWVTHEVLPTIRKTGGYIPTSKSDTDEAIMAKALLIAQKTIEHNAQQLRAKDKQIMELGPKAQALDTFTDVEDKLLIRDAAKVLSNSGTPITEKRLREWMTADGWIYKTGGSWHATAKHCTAGHLVMVMSTKYATKSDGTKTAFPPTVRITRKGLTLLHRRLVDTILKKALEATND